MRKATREEFTATYPGASLSCVTRENFEPFLLGE